jgi:hypothetical protein
LIQPVPFVTFPKPTASEYRTERFENIERLDLSLSSTGAKGGHLKMKFEDGDVLTYNFFNTTGGGPKGFREEVFEKALEALQSLKDFDDEFCVLIQNLESKKKFLSQTTRRYNERL